MMTTTIMVSTRVMPAVRVGTEPRRPALFTLELSYGKPGPAMNGGPPHAPTATETRTAYWQRPAVQVPPPVQGVFGAEQRLSPAQQPPCAQLRPAQQGVPVAPQTTQKPDAQAKPPEQAVRFWLVGVGQQGSPPSPQPEHRPDEQVPSPRPHDIPGPAHTPPRQQPPPAHASPEQHGWPWPPQVLQMPLPPQTPPALHALPEQQGSPRSPHEAQRVSKPTCVQTVSGALQARPGSCPLQHRLPSDPQLAQKPFMHAPAVNEQVIPFGTQRLV